MFLLKNVTTYFILGISSFFFMEGCTEMNKMTTPKTPALSRENMDTTIKAGDDFYHYANGGWMKKHPIPPDKSIFGAFNELQEMNNDQLKVIMVEAESNKDAKKGTVLQQIGDFYASGMDTNQIEKDGLKDLKAELDLIDNMKSNQDIQFMLSHLHSLGINPGFGLYSAPDEKNSTTVIANLYQGGLGLGDRDYYFNEDNRSKELRTEYVKYITNMFALLGDTKETASNSAEKIMNLETNLAKSSRTRLALRDPQSNYNKMPLEAIRKLTLDYDWDKYFTSLSLTVPKEVNVGQPEFFESLGKLTKNTPIEDWKAYLKWHLINATAPYLSKAFVSEHFSFHGKVLTGKEQNEPRWKRVLQETSGSLGEAVGQLYVHKYFPPEAKKRMLELVANLKTALGNRIKNLEWMSEQTKKEAQAKLERINVKIGYPDKWIDYSKLQIDRKSYLANVLRANAFNVKRELDKIGKPVDRKEWGMTPQTVNAYYSPNLNEIVFPAGILQPPFFNKDADDAVNYAAIGTVIGHEMTHGFDDQGRQYDKDGNLKDWWTKEDADKFTQHVDVLVKQYSSFLAIDSMHVDGKLTLGENIADLGGITVSYEAFKLASQGKAQNELIDGFTPLQRFYLSYAQVWRANIRDKELMRRLKIDVHSPGRFRVLGVLPNVPQFYEAFGIKPGDKMYLPVEQRAKVW